MSGSSNGTSGGNGKPKSSGTPPGYRWVMCDKVWHWRAKRYITRHDGLPFRFLVRC